MGGSLAPSPGRAPSVHQPENDTRLRVHPAAKILVRYRCNRFWILTSACQKRDILYAVMVTHNSHHHRRSQGGGCSGCTCTPPQGGEKNFFQA